MIGEPGHAAPPDIDMSHADEHPDRIKNLFEIAPQHEPLDDPDGAPFDERFGRDGRDVDPGRAPLPEGVDEGRIPGRDGNPMGGDPDEEGFSREERCRNAVVHRRHGRYDREEALINMLEFCEDEDFEEFEGSEDGDWTMERGTEGDEDGDWTMERGTEGDEDGDAEGDVTVGTSGASVGGGSSSGKTMTFTEEEQDEIIEEMQKDSEPEGDAPDQMRAEAMRGARDPDEKYVRDGFSTPSRPREDGWERHRKELEGGGGRDGGDPGDGPDRIDDSMLDANQDLVMSPAIGGGGEGGGEGGPTGPEYSPGAVAMPDMSAVLSPAIGDDGKDPDGPVGPEL